MLYDDKIYEGLSIELVVNEGPFQGRFRTRVEEVGKKILTIGVPVYERQYLPLREGTKFEVEFTDNIVAFSFRTVLLKRFFAPIPTFVIEYPTYIKKIQRRKYVRIPIISLIRYQVIDKGGLSDEKLGYLID
jgi:c-di-GMP-binding flagellar brake protein YcgR